MCADACSGRVLGVRIWQVHLSPLFRSMKSFVSGPNKNFVFFQKLPDLFLKKTSFFVASEKSSCYTKNSSCYKRLIFDGFHTIPALSTVHAENMNNHNKKGGHKLRRKKEENWFHIYKAFMWLQSYNKSNIYTV